MGFGSTFVGGDERCRGSGKVPKVVTEFLPPEETPPLYLWYAQSDPNVTDGGTETPTSTIATVIG